MVHYIYILKFNDKFRLITAMHSNGPLPQVSCYNVPDTIPTLSKKLYLNSTHFSEINDI